jgi:hypothetical protein
MEVIHEVMVACVDRSALDAALAVGFPCGGWCPLDLMTEDGVHPREVSIDAVTRRWVSRADPAQCVGQRLHGDSVLKRSIRGGAMKVVREDGPLDSVVDAASSGPLTFPGDQLLCRGIFRRGPATFLRVHGDQKGEC